MTCHCKVSDSQTILFRSRREGACAIVTHLMPEPADRHNGDGAACQGEFVAVDRYYQVVRLRSEERCDRPGQRQSQQLARDSPYNASAQVYTVTSIDTRCHRIIIVILYPRKTLGEK